MGSVCSRKKSAAEKATVVYDRRSLRNTGFSANLATSISTGNRKSGSVPSVRTTRRVCIYQLYGSREIGLFPKAVIEVDVLMVSIPESAAAAATTINMYYSTSTP